MSMNEITDEQWNNLKKKYKVHDYIYRKIRSYSEHYFFFEIDFNICSIISKRYLYFKNQKFSSDNDFLNHYYWLEIESFDDEQKKIKINIKFNKFFKEDAFEFLTKRYKINDTIKCVPIKIIKDDYILIELLPGFLGACYEKFNDFSLLNDSTVANIKINFFDYYKNRVIVNLDQGTTNKNNTLNQIINNKINKPLILKENIIRLLSQYDNLNINLDNIEDIFLDKYYKAASKGMISFRKNYEEITFDSGYKDSNNSLLCIGGYFDKKNNQYVLNFFGASPSYALNLLDLFAKIEWRNTLPSLANLALKGEKWGFTDDSYNILSGYLKLTFYKSVLDNQIFINDNQNFAIFNTGLVDDYYHSIYCCFEPSYDEKYTQKWKLSYFCTAQDKLGQEMCKHCSILPKPIKYIKNSEDALFNPDIKLIPNQEHILEGNLERFPISFIYNQCCFDENFTTLFNQYSDSKDPFHKKRLKFKIYEYIKNEPQLIRILSNRLKDSILLAQKRCRWNYRIAIPIYSSLTNSIVHLLPLCLGDIEKDGDSLALIVEKNYAEDGGIQYFGKTIITLEMAYQDARLISRLNDEWLSLDKLKST